MRRSYFAAILLALHVAGCAPLDTGHAQPPPVAARGLAGSPWASREACEAAPRPRRAQGRARIATWNVRWFPDGAASRTADPARETDIEWLACALASLRADVIGLQEIVLHERGRAAMQRVITALDRRTGGRWEMRDDGCPAEHQHLAFLFDRSRVHVERSEMIASLNPTGEACGQRLRPGLLASFRWAGGLDLAVLVLHLDSGTTQRDHDRRRATLAALGPALAETRARDRDVIVLGDLNTMGCRGCAPASNAEAELTTLDAELTLAGLERLASTESCTEYSGSHPSHLDHMAASQGMEELPDNPTAEIGGVCEALSCRRPPRDPSPAALEHLSDHCPIVLELEDTDQDD